MADELDEGLADEEAVATLRRCEVAQSEQRVEEANEDTGDKLSCPVSPPPAGELIIPPGRQKLLAVWLSYKLKEKKRWKSFTFHVLFELERWDKNDSEGFLIH